MRSKRIWLQRRRSKPIGAAVEASQVNLGFTKVNSPIDGLAGIALAQIGDLVGPNGPVLTTVSTIDPIRVFFTTSEQAYLTYRHQYTNVTERATHEQELELQLLLADGSVYPHRGRFVFAAREVNPTTGTIQLVGLFPNPDTCPSARPIRSRSGEDRNAQGRAPCPATSRLGIARQLPDRCRQCRQQSPYPTGYPR